MQEINPSSSIHLTFHEFELGDLAFGLGIDHGRVIAAQTAALSLAVLDRNGGGSALMWGENILEKIRCRTVACKYRRHSGRVGPPEAAFCPYSKI